MSQQSVTTKAALLAAIDPAWTALNAAIDRLSEDQLTARRDAQGWTVKDHLIHLTAWERSVIFLLQGKPRHDGLGVSADVYLHGDDDAINAAIYQQRRTLPLAEALAQFRAVHQQLMRMLQPLSDADIQQPYRHYLPNEPGDGGDRPVIDLISGNTVHHFAEHLAWIHSLVDA